MFSKFLPQLISLTIEAGNTVISLQSNAPDYSTKKDKTPVTEADKASNKIIVSSLEKLTPNIPILSEESKEVPFLERKKWTKYWLIDPLDGTRDFIEGSRDFCISIALIEKNYPIFGLIYSPFEKVHYYRLPQQKSIKLIDNVAHKLCTKKPKRWEKIVFGRYSQNNKQLQRHLRSKTNFETFRLGSALKFCFIAEGIYHYYPKFGKCSEWDTAAGVCILEGAGGKILDLQGQPLEYNTKEDTSSPKFIASA